MLEVKAVYFVLLAEGFGVSIFILLLMTTMLIRRFRRNRKAVDQLVSQIKHQSDIRTGKTGSFLKEIYDLEDEELKGAIETIDKQEKRFFQKIIKMFLHSDTELLTTMDAALAEIVETYRKLKPKVPEGQDEVSLQEVLKEVEALKLKNEKLKESLELSNSTMAGMIAEFGNMFGGGKGHEMADHEVVEKVVEQE